MLVPHPAFTKLKSEIAQLRTEISILVLERDQLLYVECKNIEAAYLLAVGGLEYRAFELETEIRALRRKASLIQAQKNRQEKVDLVLIEMQIKLELEAFWAELEKQRETLDAAMTHAGSPSLSSEDTAELKHLYRRIVKALHPDLNPNPSDDDLYLYIKAVEVYESGNIASMRAIADMIELKPETSAEVLGLDELNAEVKRLKPMLKTLLNHIADIKASYPYLWIEVLDDPDALEKRRDELKEHISELGKALDQQVQHIEDLLR